MMKYIAIAAAFAAWGSTATANSHQTDASADVAAPDPGATIAMMGDVDLEAAEKLFKRNCSACHGKKAQGVASYPKLNDKDAEYIAEKLEIYRSGERIGPNSVLMIQNAKKLSDADIAGLAVYVSTAFD
jgi:cytochrome c553